MVRSDPLWAGAELAGLPLAWIGKSDYRWWRKSPELSNEASGPGSYRPPEGAVLAFADRRGVLRTHGLYVSIEAPNEELVLVAARALEPMPASVGSGARR